MKFGKHIQAQQVPGWSAYYLDYKFLKKIISSLTANRPALETSILALGARPTEPLNPPLPIESFTGPETRVPTSILADSPGQPPIFTASDNDGERGPNFQAHKAAFFFKLERELEKVNAFYLQKEAELKLRMETLLSKRRAAAMRGLPDATGNVAQIHVEWSAVEEGFRLLERDLGKLQQFVEINATGFRKILKKYDKRSTSTTKELYLARQVDVQPVFNRQLISELADTVAACLADITDLTSGLRFEGSAANDIITQQILTEHTSPSGPFRDLENILHKAVAASDPTMIMDCVRYSDILSQQSGGKTNVTRILWNVIIEAPPDMADLILASLSVPFDYHFVDDINGRTCLHEAAIAGALRLVDLCIQNNVSVDKTDLYGRTAIHYSCMNGHAAVCKRLIQAKIPTDTLDRDNYSPLVYATLKGTVECVRVLLEDGNVPVQSPTPSSDLIPLSLACQSGHVDTVLLLLQNGAQCLANSNGEYPMHLAAREGHTEVCKLLVHLEGWDTPDKYQEWTPLFHAARNGRDSCVEILIGAGCQVRSRDEVGHYATHYAAWYGHHECLSLLLNSSQYKFSSPTLRFQNATEKSPASDFNLSTDSEIDMIPSLSLPPPIMPHRVYGHNYLDKSHLIQVAVGCSARSLFDHSPGVRLHHRLISPAFKDEYLLASSPLKLVMTPTTHDISAPYSISLPQKDENGLFVFQIPSPEELSLQFSIYPNFGTKTLGRAIALPSLFANVRDSQCFTLPILDHRLHAIGEIDFELDVITSFEGVNLGMGGGLETYWKSTATSFAPISQQRQLRESPIHGGHISSVQTSPSIHSMNNTTNHALTVSSLHGKYIYFVVQVTRDLHPVVYAEWLLPGTDFDLGVADVSLAQFEALSHRMGRDTVSATTVEDWSVDSPRIMLSLDRLMKLLPLDISIGLDLAHPSRATQNRLQFNSKLDVNVFVDSILRTIFNASSSQVSWHTRRRIVFTSFSPGVCSALNWKQPNYPVLFSSHCGKNIESLPSHTAEGSAGNDRRISSRLGAAVDFAKVNNLLGIFVNAELLLQVPSLIRSIKNSELLIGIYGASDKVFELSALFDTDMNPVDAYVSGGTMTFINHVLQ